MPRNAHVWLVFDLSNGDRHTKRYVWWFDTRQSARQHIAHAARMKNAAKLSQPIKFYR